MGHFGFVSHFDRVGLQFLKFGHLRLYICHVVLAVENAL